MASKRRVNWISQQRVDVPDVRAVESAVSNDFDELIQSFVTGTGQGYILRGFEISMAGAIGGAASGLQMIVDPGAVFHVNSSQSGTFYLVTPGTLPQQLNSATNPLVDGAFAPSAINYISLEYERFIDDATSSQVYLWNPTTNNETTKNAPRAQILRYRIKITTSLPPANYIPVASVTTDSGNNVVRIDDARSLLFSQGKGGFNPDPFYTFSYTQGRTPNPTFSQSNSVNPFQGGDKSIGTLKDKLDAITSEIQSIKGTTYWTSQSSSGSLESLRGDLGNTFIAGRGTISHSDVTPGLLNWSEDIHIRVVGSRLSYTLVANPSSTDVTLGENEVAYINLVRGVTVTPSLVFTNNSPIITSVGSIAWTGPLQSGDWIKLGSDTDSGYYQILTVDSLTQVTLTEPYGGPSTGPGGAKAKYAFGTYQTSPSPSSSRDIYVAPREEVPAGENIFWLYVRSDSGGATARVYVRFLGSELQAGESEDISDNTSHNILEYVGSPIESATKPQYASAINAGALPEITDLQFGDASLISSNQYFFINSSANARKYYFWFNKDGTGVDPEPLAELIGIEVPISTGQTAQNIADAAATALGSTFYDDFQAVVRVVPNDDTVRVTNSAAGTTANPANFNVGGLTITTIQEGTGDGNFIVNDGDNLTKAIKKLDQAFGAILASLDDPSYDEKLTVVSGVAGADELSGPVAINTLISLPDNSRMGDITQYYTVGKGNLQVFLNGQLLRGDGSDWAEVGLTGTLSSEIQIKQALVVDDVLVFRISAGGAGAGGGGGGQGPQGPPGVQGPPGQDALGGPVTISTKNADYTITLSDKVTKADCSSGNVTLQLPPAASAAGYVFYFKKIDGTSNNMIVQAYASELIDGLNNISTNVQWEAFMLVSDGAVWSIH